MQIEHIVYIGTERETKYFASENNFGIAGQKVEGRPQVIQASQDNWRGLRCETTVYMTPNHRNLDQRERMIWEGCHSRYEKFTGAEEGL
jgi:hypothetical protein